MSVSAPAYLPGFWGPRRLTWEASERVLLQTSGVKSTVLIQIVLTAQIMRELKKVRTFPSIVEG